MDKSYRSVEYSRSFFSKKSRNWRDESFVIPKKTEEDFPDLAQLLNLNQRTISRLFSNQVDYDYEQDPRAEKFDETNQVKNLDTWRPKTPLQPAFKVLDTTEKNNRVKFFNIFLFFSFKYLFMFHHYFINSIDQE